MEEAVIFFLAVCGETSRLGNGKGKGEHQETYVVAMGEVTSVGETETHETVLRLEKCSQRRKTRKGSKNQILCPGEGAENHLLSSLHVMPIASTIRGKNQHRAHKSHTKHRGNSHCQSMAGR